MTIHLKNKQPGDDEAWLQKYAEQLFENDAHLKCYRVFMADDREFARQTVLASMGNFDVGLDQETTKQARLFVTTRIRSYYEEAEAIRTAFTSWENRLERLRTTLAKLQAQPPSAGALAVLALGVSEAQIKDMLSRIGKNAAQKGLATDARQKAKRFVYDCWRDWQDGKTTYTGQAAFARDMLSKWEGVLKSQPSIENWCRQWKKGENIPLIEPA